MSDDKKMNPDSKGNLFRKEEEEKKIREDQIPDLDRDGNIGNTGGFYGGTSYTGSNYSEDWKTEEDRGRGNYGAAGENDSMRGNKKDEDEVEE